MIHLGGKVESLVGDITEENTEAIVNAANSSLLGGGGVDGAIHRAGGPEIDKECRKIRERLYPEGLPPGRAMATSGGNLKAKHVIHTVGPVWQGGKKGERDILRAAYLNSLAEAEKLGAGSISFPAISTGIYGFPADIAARIVSSALSDYFQTKRSINLVRLVFFSQREYDIFVKNADFGL